MFLTWCNVFGRVSLGYCRLLGLRQQWNSPSKKRTSNPVNTLLHRPEILQRQKRRGKEKKEKNQNSKQCHCYLAEMVFVVVWAGGEKATQTTPLSAGVCDKGISETAASSRAGIKRGTSSSSSCARSSSLCLCVVWHAFPGSSGSQESQPDNRFSLSSSTNNASHLPSPPASHTPPALFSLVFVHICQGG